jgi:hypothetical protein
LADRVAMVSLLAQMIDPWLAGSHRRRTAPELHCPDNRQRLTVHARAGVVAWN